MTGHEHPGLIAALAQLAELHRQGESALHLLVLACRDQGCSWAEIGEALGVTRQAAQQRYGSNATDTPEVLDGNVS